MIASKIEIDKTKKKKKKKKKKNSEIINLKILLLNVNN
jgi:hypothetical protein